MTAPRFPPTMRALRGLAMAGAVFLMPACAADFSLPARVLDAHTHAAGEMERAFGAANVVGAVVMLPQGSATPRDVPVPSRQCAGIGTEPDVAGVAAALEAGQVACVKIG